jgi:hypothetical protein
LLVDGEDGSRTTRDDGVFIERETGRDGRIIFDFRL